MDIQLTWASIGIILAILGHAYHTIVWSSKMTTQLENMADSFKRLDKELEKRDIQLTAAWKKIDLLSERVIVIEAKCHVSHKEE